MLASQRHLFDMPREVCYLNAASWSPLPLATQEAGRAAAAKLINAAPTDVALISSVGYGVATAGKLLSVPKGSRVILLENDHTSPFLEWQVRAPAEGFTVEVVSQPENTDWTAAVLAAIERPGAAPVGLASISSVHWSDSGAIDLTAVAAALRKQGAAFLIDATHAVGVMKIDVQALDPDFLIFPTYKWVLGPYGRAFLYVAKRRQDGVPLEQTSYGRRAVGSENSEYMRDTRYVADARRFDMGERDHFISMEMASIGMEMMAAWGQPPIQERLQMLTDRLANGLHNMGVRMPERRVRAPHILSLHFPTGMPARLIERLAAERIYVAPRVGRVRISPHVYNDEEDIDRFVATFRRLAYP